MDKAYVYVETAFHHEGDMDYIKRLIEKAAEIGVDGIKFQVLTEVSDFISTQHSAFDTLKEYTFNSQEWSAIFSHATNLELDIIMMPLNLGAFALLDEHEIKYLDIHSVSFYDEKLLAEVKAAELPIILGVGGRTLAEIDEKIAYFEGNMEVLMVGYQAFPSALADVKIGKITHLAARYPNLTLGYADHSAHDDPFNITSNEYARLLGATVFEKHMTLEQGVARVDYNSAVGPETIQQMMQRIRFIEAAILTDTETSFEFHEKETAYRNRQLVCVAANEIPAGTVLSEDDIRLKMVDAHADNQYRTSALVGKTTQNSIKKDVPIHLQNLKDE